MYDLLLAFPTSNSAEFDASVRRTAIQVKRKPPCKRWMLQVIGQCDPNHFIFSKAHTKRDARPKQAAEETYIPNPDGLFDGLELHMQNGGKSKRATNFWKDDIDPR